MKAAREAGATPAELRSAISMAEKVRQVQIVKADKFSRKVRELLTEADIG